jgi:hypothetical protein
MTTAVIGVLVRCEADVAAAEDARPAPIPVDPKLPGDLFA